MLSYFKVITRLEISNFNLKTLQIKQNVSQVYKIEKKLKFELFTVTTPDIRNVFNIKKHPEVASQEYICNILSMHLTYVMLFRHLFCECIFDKVFMLMHLKHEYVM